MVEVLSLAKLGKLLCQHLPCYNSVWYIVDVDLVAAHDVLSHIESKYVHSVTSKINSPLHIVHIEPCMQGRQLYR